MLSLFSPTTSAPTPSDPVAQLIAMGGPVMAVLMVMAVLGFIAFLYLMFQGTLLAPRNTRLLKRTMTDWQQNPRQEAIAHLQTNANAWARLNPLHNLVRSIMASRLRGESIEHIRDSAALHARQALEPFEAPLKLIEVIAALAPLLGLLGTVIGMMEAFSTMASAEGRASASQLSGGIYQALTTTAAGLVVAIPFAALAAWIEFRLRRLQGTVNQVLTTVLGVPVSDTNPTTESSPNYRESSEETDTPQNWQRHKLVNAVT